MSTSTIACREPNQPINWCKTFWRIEGCVVNRGGFSLKGFTFSIRTSQYWTFNRWRMHTRCWNGSRRRFAKKIKRKEDCVVKPDFIRTHKKTLRLEGSQQQWSLIYINWWFEELGWSSTRRTSANLGLKFCMTCRDFSLPSSFLSDTSLSKLRKHFVLGFFQMSVAANIKIRFETVKQCSGMCFKLHT